MKTSVKMIIALALALTMICALGTAAFADAPLTTTILKNPTNERHYAGETATFIADAANYNSLEWRFLNPNGVDFSLDGFKMQFPGAGVTGQGTTTLKISNLQTGMEGWRVYCRFFLGAAHSDTASANIGVNVPSAPVYTQPVTTVYPTTVYPTTVYYEYEPDYVYVNGARVYSDGTVVYDEDYAPDYILPDGSRVYSVPVDEDYAPDYVLVDGARVYSDGSVVYDEDFAPDYILSDGSRVYDLNNYEPDYIWVNGVQVYSDGSIVY